jgi:hypothetical protein
MNLQHSFKWRHSEAEIIFFCVCLHLCYDIDSYDP